MSTLSPLSCLVYCQCYVALLTILSSLKTRYTLSSCLLPWVIMTDPLSPFLTQFSIISSTQNSFSSKGPLLDLPRKVRLVPLIRFQICEFRNTAQVSRMHQKTLTSYPTFSVHSSLVFSDVLDSDFDPTLACCHCRNPTTEVPGNVINNTPLVLIRLTSRIKSVRTSETEELVFSSITESELL